MYRGRCRSSEAVVEVVVVVVVVALVVMMVALVAVDAREGVQDFILKGGDGLAVVFVEGETSWAIRRMPHAAVEMDTGGERNDGRQSTQHP